MSDKVQQTGCLVLGAIARALNKTDPDRADRVVHHLETWLHKDKGT